MLEAGVSGEHDPSVLAPGRWVSLMGSSYDWSYATEPEPGLDGRRIAVPRGKAHGGSSAINAMVHIRGSRSCFDGWRARRQSWLGLRRAHTVLRARSAARDRSGRRSAREPPGVPARRRRAWIWRQPAATTSTVPTRRASPDFFRRTSSMGDGTAPPPHSWRQRFSGRTSRSGHRCTPRACCWKGSASSASSMFATTAARWCGRSGKWWCVRAPSTLRSC